jgi:hypothetical protein
MLSISHFHYAHGVDTRRLAQSSDSLVRVSRRVGCAHFVRVTLNERVRPHAWRAQVACETPRRSDDPAAERASVKSSALYTPVARRPRGAPQRRAKPTLTARGKVHPKGLNCHAHTGSKRFPPNKFRYFLTLFSKFFASFPHGTCSLSVSRQYLALGEIYLPFRLQSRATRLSGTHKHRRRWPNTGLSPSLAPLSRGLGPRRRLEYTPSDYNSKLARRKV